MYMGWIKVHRILMNKPIWLKSTPEQKAILITLLMLANHEQAEWEWFGQKFKVNPGQFITSLETIKNYTGKGISIQNVRSALNRFQKLEFLTNKSTKTGRLITILNWDSYQITKDEHNKEANKQVTKTQQRGNKEVTSNKNNINERKKEFKKIILQYIDEFPYQMLQEFFDYWSESNKSQTKMKWESEKTWELYKRLLRWAKNSKIYIQWRGNKIREEAIKRNKDTSLLNILGAENIGRKVEDIENPDNTPLFK